MTVAPRIARCTLTTRSTATLRKRGFARLLVRVIADVRVRVERVLTFVVLYLGLSTVLALVLLAGIFPYHPKTVIGWVLLFALALPLTLLGEFVGEFFWRNRIAQAIAARSSGGSLSVLRLGYAFAVMLFFFALAFGVHSWLGVE